jgi:hypothetical protein
MLEPFGVVPGSEKPGNVFARCFDKEPISDLADAGELMGAALLLKQNTTQAIKQGNRPWLGQLKGNAKELASAAGGFIKQALIIAIAKFVLEVCALVINSIMDSLNKRGKAGVEITTPNVRYSAPGSVPPGPTQTQRSYSNPFEAAFSSASVSPF